VVEDGFERADVLAHRRGGQPEFASRLGEGAQLDDAEKITMGQVIHGIVFHLCAGVVEGAGSTIARDVVW
jgi:hypothetical protein